MSSVGEFSNEFPSLWFYSDYVTCLYYFVKIFSKLCFIPRDSPEPELLSFTMGHEISVTTGLEGTKIETGFPPPRNQNKLQTCFILSLQLRRLIFKSGSCSNVCKLQCRHINHPFQDHTGYARSRHRQNKWCSCRCNFGPKIDLHSSGGLTEGLWFSVAMSS